MASSTGGRSRVYPRYREVTRGADLLRSRTSGLGGSFTDLDARDDGGPAGRGASLPATSFDLPRKQRQRSPVRCTEA